jgi:hypothetical protein
MRLTAQVIRNQLGEEYFFFRRTFTISISLVQKGNHIYPYTHKWWGITRTSFVQFRPSDIPDQKETFTFGPGQCIKYIRIENEYGLHIHDPIVCDQKDADIKEPLHAESESDADFGDDPMSYMYITYEEALKIRLERAVKAEHGKQKRAAKKLRKQTEEWKTHRREKMTAKMEARLLQRAIP